MFPRFLQKFHADELTASAQETEYLIIGSGIAGMYAALLLAQHGQVVLLSKGTITGGSTVLAQGGVAAALGREDSPEHHLQDTLLAGAGHCDKEAAKVLTNEGPQRIRELIDLGVPFDCKQGELALTREGAHSFPRILHAGGDATGKAISSTLASHLKKAGSINIMEHTMAVDLLCTNNRCSGVLALNNQQHPFLILAKAVIIATGGIGQIYEKTTNPWEATGDGIAMAFRAGAEIADMEFVQFHPTMLEHPQMPGFLISEAVRGEGAKLCNAAGKRFMPAYHRLADLAPRDIVARAIEDQKQKTGKQVYLDATHIDKNYFSKRFPSIYQACQKIGLDPARDWIPVTCGAHYLMGGIKTDTWGRTSILGLYACGEAACTGVHGANRLASNSLLEGLVFSYRTAQAIADNKAPGLEECFHINRSFDESHSHSICAINKQQALNPLKPVNLQDIDIRLRGYMQKHVGVIRNRQGLKEVLNFLHSHVYLLNYHMKNIEGIQLQNKLIIAYLVTRAALQNETSAGAHYRDDFPPAALQLISNDI
ncbi:MAG: L-aspartate oxidase [Bacillota bacterium]